MFGGSHHEGNLPTGYQTPPLALRFSIFTFQRTGTGNSLQTQRTSLYYDGFDSKRPYYYYFAKFEFQEILTKIFSVFS